MNQPPVDTMVDLGTMGSGSGSGPGPAAASLLGVQLSHCPFRYRDVRELFMWLEGCRWQTSNCDQWFYKDGQTQTDRWQEWRQPTCMKPPNTRKAPTRPWYPWKSLSTRGPSGKAALCQHFTAVFMQHKRLQLVSLLKYCHQCLNPTPSKATTWCHKTFKK